MIFFPEKSSKILPVEDSTPTDKIDVEISEENEPEDKDVTQEDKIVSPKKTVSLSYLYYP